MADFTAGFVLAIVICVCVALAFNFKAIGSMQEDCQKQNNVYRCVMTYVPADAE